MVLAEQEQEVGQLRVGERVALGEQDTLQLAAGRQQLPQAAHVLVPTAESPARGTARWRYPAGQEIAAAFAQLAQHMGQQRHGPVESPTDPAHELATGDPGRVTAQRGCQGGQGEPLDDEPGDHRQDLAEAGRLVGHVGAGIHAREAAAGDGELLDEDGMLGIPGGTAAPAVSAKRPHARDDSGVEQRDPARVILGG